MFGGQLTNFALNFCQYSLVASDILWSDVHQSVHTSEVGGGEGRGGGGGGEGGGYDLRYHDSAPHLMTSSRTVAMSD